MKWQLIHLMALACFLLAIGAPLAQATNTAPVAAIATPPDYSCVDNTIEFDGSSSYDPDSTPPGNTIAGYIWSCSGQTGGQCTIVSGQNSDTVQIRFDSADTFDVTLIVTDDLDANSLPVTVSLDIIDLTTGSNPLPENDATDITRYTKLGWDSGINAASYDVYLGQSSSAVADANRATEVGVTIGVIVCVGNGISVAAGIGIGVRVAVGV